jgi:hypothetical protein
VREPDRIPQFLDPGAEAIIEGIDGAAPVVLPYRSHQIRPGAIAFDAQFPAREAKGAEQARPTVSVIKFADAPGVFVFEELDQSSEQAQRW